MPLLESCSLNYFVKTFYPARLLHPARLTILRLFSTLFAKLFKIFKVLSGIQSLNDSAIFQILMWLLMLLVAFKPIIFKNLQSLYPD